MRRRQSANASASGPSHDAADSPLLRRTSAELGWLLAVADRPRRRAHREAGAGGRVCHASRPRTADAIRRCVYATTLGW